VTDLALCFYGDDFTGSTDALANLSAAGLRTLVLFALPPEPELKRLAGLYDALGVAGIARSLPTGEMEAEVRPVFEAFARLRPAVVQYKICSTFDSSPSRGSIGRACEIGHAVFGACAIPVVAAQPQLGRYTVFGNHFARAGDGAIYRLDRHPAMSRHPATPMTEPDLVVHLQAQTALPVIGLNRLELDDYAVVAARHAGPLVLDALDEADLDRIASLIWSSDDEPTLFAVGSGGLSRVLGARLAQRGTRRALDPAPDAAPSGPVLAVSGSCAPQTGAQIGAALDAGWYGVHLPVERLDAGAAEDDVLTALRAGRDTVVYTALGAQPSAAPVDPRAVGTALGALVRAAVARAGVRRVVVAGGDTAGQTMRALGASGLAYAGSIADGAPLCRLFARDPLLDGLDVVLKGGQVGERSFFEHVRNGKYVPAR